MNDVDAQVRVITNGLLHDEVLSFVNAAIAHGPFDPSVEPVADIEVIMQARDLQSPNPFSDLS